MQKQPVTVSSKDVVATKETRADRLNRLIAKMLPGQTEAIKTGTWGKDGAPYRFSTLPDGRQKLVVTDPETESSKGFIGTDRDDLLNQFEAWLPK